MIQQLTTVITALVAASGLAAQAQAAPPQYRFEVIAFPGDATAINNAGLVAGTASFGGASAQRGYTWSPGEGLSALPLQENGAVFTPRDIDSAGAVAGELATQGGTSRAVLATLSGEGLFLGSRSFSSAAAFDANGRIYGEAGLPTSELVLFFDDPDAQSSVPLVTGLNGLSVAGGGNNAALGSVSNRAAVISPDGTFTLLADPFPPNSNFFTIEATDQNSEGVIVGSEAVNDYTSRTVETPVQWNAQGEPSVLPILDPVFIRTKPFAINDEGVIVGTSAELFAQQGVATLWSEGEAFDLNDLADTPSGVTLTAARSINASGEIVGTFTDATLGGATGAFIAFPVDDSCSIADVAAPFGVLDLSDVQRFTAEFIAGSPVADLDNSGVTDLTDIQRFIAAFVVGCP